MELRHLRYFIALAEELHFARAAARLRISQPPLSRQIQRLEQELGTLLLHRTKRRVELTPAGEVFLQEARLAVAQTERAGTAARRAAQGETGRLSIGFVPAADLKVLPTLIPCFRQTAPAVQLVLHSLSAAAQLQAVRDGRIDLGFVFGPVFDKDLAWETVLREPFVVVLPSKHHLVQRRRCPLRALQGEPFIFFRRELAPAYFDYVMGFCQRARFTATITQESDHIQTNLGLVAAGLGLSLLPEAVTGVKRYGVIYRPLAPPVPYVETAVIYRRDDRSEALQAFLNVVRSTARTVFRAGRGARRGGKQDSGFKRRHS
jgi:DNA-binding transcriptional LysR family regulator